MEYVINYKEKGKESKMLIAFCLLINNETKELIRNFFCIAYRKDLIVGGKILCSIEDEVVKNIGPLGQMAQIDGKEVYKLVDDERNECFYYLLNFTFMDTCFVEGAMEEVEKMKEAKKSSTGIELKLKSKVKLDVIINRALKYKMEEQIDEEI
ncbi:MAG: hypothetical protein ACRCZ9_05595 [Fusobacteriaceae bacterium]